MNIKNSLYAITLVAVAALGLTGCGGVQTTEKPAPEASVAAPVVEETPEPPVENPLIQPLGGVVTYTDGVSISVSTPADFVPTEYAAGADQAHQVVFTLVLTNGSTAPLDPYAYPTVSSGGAEATQIIDMDNPVGEVNFGPDTVVLPGQTVQWLQAYSIADPTKITVGVAPGLEYEDAIFTNIAF